MRDIDDVLPMRRDLSPFLVHMTKKRGATTATEVLRAILDGGALAQAGNPFSTAKYGGSTAAMSPADKSRFFSALCFTEVPLGEIHGMLEILRYPTDLEPYGIVFVKKALLAKGVEPVLYLNNVSGNKAPILQQLFTLIQTTPQLAEQLLPLVSHFGQRVTAPGAVQQGGSIDFSWEREWRLPFARGALAFNHEAEVFVALCPDEEIAAFEARYQGLPFIDPRRPLAWYAKKLLDRAQALGLRPTFM